MNNDNISPEWVKMVSLDNPSEPTYCTARFAVVGMTAREVIDVLQNGPIVEDAYIIEPIVESNLPAFVEWPEDRIFLQGLLNETGLTGSGRRFEETIFKGPYEYLGFERAMSFGPDHHVYRRNGVPYSSLGRMFYTAGIRVNPAFIALLMDIDNDPESNLIWFVTSTHRGMNRSFDILYDVRYRSYLLELGQKYQQEFVSDRQPIELLVDPTLLEPLQPQSTAPYDVLYEHYFGDCRYDAAESSGANEYQKALAIFADSIDYAFRKWLVIPKTNLRRVYYHIGGIIQCEYKEAPETVGTVLSDLKQQLISYEFYELMPRFEKGLQKINKQFGL